MELRHLRYFIAVAEEENVTRAALRLGVSQPPLSRQIRDLEEEMGVQLLERRVRSIKLTKAGSAFLKHARAVLAHVEKSVKAAQTIASEKIELRIGYTPALTTELLPRIVRAFTRSQPSVRMVMHDSVSVEIISLIQTGKLDAGLIAKHPGERNHPLHYETLERYTVGVILPKAHRLAKRRSPEIDEVLDEPIAVLNRERFVAFHAWTRRVFGRQFSRVRIVEDCDSVPSLIAAVECERAVAACSEGHIRPARGRIAFVPFVPAMPPIEIGVGCLRRSLASHPIRHFIETARAVVSAPSDRRRSSC